MFSSPVHPYQICTSVQATSSPLYATLIQEHFLLNCRQQLGSEFPIHALRPRSWSLSSGAARPATTIANQSAHFHARRNSQSQPPEAHLRTMRIPKPLLSIRSLIANTSSNRHTPTIRILPNTLFFNNIQFSNRHINAFDSPRFSTTHPLHASPTLPISFHVFILQRHRAPVPMVHAHNLIFCYSGNIRSGSGV
jgi:hypothetical protein